MRSLRGVLAILLLPAALVTGASAARAQSAPNQPAPPGQQVGPDQAQALTRQLRDWLRGMAGPQATIPDLRTTAEGDHYRLTLPIPALEGPDKDITAALRPLDAGRWQADTITLPADTAFTAKMPPPKGAPGPATMHLHLTIAGQNSHATIDPAMTGDSSMVVNLNGVALDGDRDGRKQTQRFDTFHQVLTLRPVAAGKLDLDEDSDAIGWKSAQELPNGRAMAIGAEQMTGSVRIVGLDRSQAATLGPVLGALASAPTPERNERLRALVVALHGLMTSLKFDETIQNMQIAVAGQGSATIDRVHLGFDTAAPKGVAQTSLAASLDGVAVPGMAPTAGALAPRHVKLGLSLGGVSTEALSDLALAALTPGANPRTLAPQIGALFADPGKTGGPRFGIDTLGFDLGPAQIEGHGSIVAVSQNDMRATARVTVTGFDALADRIREDPQLQQILPFLILARGMARSEGSALIWDIVFTPSGLTVNGVNPGNLLAQPKRPKQRP
jgi:hypothetical protein